jgi:hypothetical protein
MVVLVLTNNEPRDINIRKHPVAALGHVGHGGSFALVA